MDRTILCCGCMLSHLFWHARLNERRLRFTVAHEIGHLLCLISAPTYLHQGERQAPSIEEREANRFAAELLVSADEVSEEFRLLTRAGLREKDAFGILTSRFVVTSGPWTGGSSNWARLRTDARVKTGATIRHGMVGDGTWITQGNWHAISKRPVPWCV